MKIILASKSPRRKELLKKVIDEFEIIPSNIDETKYSLSEISRQKALKIAEKYPSDLIISADTVVCLNNIILGKPKDEIEAFNMLKLLSGKIHKVITYYSICIKNKNIFINRNVVTKVKFNQLDDKLIKEYVKSGSPLDKAGAYGIQDHEFNLVDNIDGEEENVIGLPIKELAIDLKHLGINTK